MSGMRRRAGLGTTLILGAIGLAAALDGAGRVFFEKTLASTSLAWILALAAGSLALVGSKVAGDAGVVTRLREAGVLLLGKANMSEWSAFRGWPLHGGWSARAGIGRNPYALAFSTGDSSSGSAAAASANLAAGAVGMETYGSIVMPSSLCGVVGLKPTYGLVSRSRTIGISFSPAPPYGPFTGAQTIPFTETITAPTLVGSYTCTVTAVITPGGPTTAVQTVNVTVTPGPPATLTLAPKTATNTVDAQHCVTATVKDAFGNATPGITVRFSVNPTTFRTPSSGSAVTGAAGTAQFCYTSAFIGSDVITAYADTNGNNVRDANEPGDTAAKTWVLPQSTPGCKVTYGGRITAANGDKATFGGNAKTHPKKASPQGQEQFQDHGPAANLNVHSLDVRAVTCNARDTAASIFGKARINGSGSFDYRIDLQDLGEPGRNDTYRIRLSTGYDSGVRKLRGGNVQIH